MLWSTVTARLIPLLKSLNFFPSSCYDISCFPSICWKIWNQTKPLSLYIPPSRQLSKKNDGYDERYTTRGQRLQKVEGRRPRGHSSGHFLFLKLPGDVGKRKKRVRKWSAISPWAVSLQSPRFFWGSPGEKERINCGGTGSPNGPRELFCVPQRTPRANRLAFPSGWPLLRLNKWSAELRWKECYSPTIFMLDEQRTFFRFVLLDLVLDPRLPWGHFPFFFWNPFTRLLRWTSFEYYSNPHLIVDSEQQFFIGRSSYQTSDSNQTDCLRTLFMRLVPWPRCGIKGVVFS